MTSEPNNTSPNSTGGPAGLPARRTLSRRFMTSAAIIAVLAIGAVGGAGASRFAHRYWPEAVMLLQPAPIAQLKDATPVAIKGQVAEVFGNKFIVQDDSGRTLVDTGPRGERGKPVAKGEAVTVQGHFENGFIRAQLMTRADGITEALARVRANARTVAPVPIVVPASIAARGLTRRRPRRRRANRNSGRGTIRARIASHLSK